MILKSLSRKSNGSSLVTYVLRYATKDKLPKHDKEEATVILRHNLRSKSVKDDIQAFRENEAFRLYKRSNTVILHHEVISFNPLSKEHLTDEVLRAIAQKYIELRGTNNLYLIVAHRDKTAHTHLHAVVSGVQLDGRSNRISKNQFKALKCELERYQKEQHPELFHSHITHEKEPRSKEDIISSIQKNRQTKKAAILEHLIQAQAIAPSKEAFLAHLKAQGYDAYYRGEKLQGIVHEGTKYRFSNLGYDAAKIETLEQPKEQSIESLCSPLIAPSKVTIPQEKGSVQEPVPTTEEQMLAELSALRFSNERTIDALEIER